MLDFASHVEFRCLLTQRTRVLYNPTRVENLHSNQCVMSAFCGFFVLFTVYVAYFRPWAPFALPTFTAPIRSKSLRVRVKTRRAQDAGIVLVPRRMWVVHDSIGRRSYIGGRLTLGLISTRESECRARQSVDPLRLGGRDAARLVVGDANLAPVCGETSSETMSKETPRRSGPVAARS